MTEYLESNRNDTATAPVETVLESDLARHTSETDLLDYLNDLGGQEADWDRRNEYLAPLWAAEEFILLALAYERIQQHFALDLDATYQLAAVRAQLGDWAKVNHLIQVWQRIGAFSDEDVQNALLRDGRFAHYIRYRRVIARTTPQT